MVGTIGTVVGQSPVGRKSNRGVSGRVRREGWRKWGGGGARRNVVWLAQGVLWSGSVQQVRDMLEFCNLVYGNTDIIRYAYGSSHTGNMEETEFT